MTDTPVNKSASLQAIYVKIARIAVEMNKPYLADQAPVRTELNPSVAEADNTLNSNVVYLNRNCPGCLPLKLCAYQAMRREFTRTFGSWAMAWMTFQRCFLAVAMNERMVAKSVAPAMQRKPPEIFCLTFIMRASRSA
jgi:hypothetical protein